MGIIILVLVAAGVATLLIVAASKSNSFRIEREADFDAPPQALYGQVADFHNWQAWSPWERLDAGLQRSHSGAESGRGAVYAWKGNSKAGEGRMEITEAAAPSKIVIRLEFIKPFKATNTAEFVFQPAGDGTRVTWAMFGPRPFIAKVMGTLFNMDDLVGKDFEAGLNNLRAVVEPQAETDAGAAIQGAQS